MKNNLGKQLIESLEIVLNKNISNEEKVYSLYLLLSIVSEEATVDENLSFNTLFARLSFIANAHNISKKTIYYIHLFRIYNERKTLNATTTPHVLALGETYIYNLINELWNLHKSEKVLSQDTIALFEQEKPPAKEFYHLIEALVIKIDYAAKHIIFLHDGSPGEKCKAEFDIPHINEPFTPNILAIEKIYNLPLHLNFIDCELLENDVYRPKAFVINPDYLMDVTAIASNSETRNADIWLYGMHKFLEKPNSKYIIIGNIANYFLDALIANPDIELNQLFKELFKLYPLEFASYSDQEINEIISDIKTHFQNLKRVIHEDFIQKNILVGQIYLEPSFYCRDFGIQGRLDLFHLNKSTNKADIIELKSGKPFMPNTYGINGSHYIQTLLYDMMITSAYQGKISPQNYILYSKLEHSNLKYAPRLKAQQFEILKIRNELIAIDHSLSKGPEMVEKVANYLISENYLGLKGFKKTDLKTFEDIYQTSSTIEKLYFTNFVSFVGREAILSKTGEHGISKSNGLAALWLENLQEKEDRFSILNYLQIIENSSEEKDPIMVFDKSELTAELTNFRKGDIAVLYPHHHNARNILRHQIFKCSILEITPEQIKVRLRSPQYNQSVFKETEYWNLEQDVLSSSFNHMYRNLFTFLAASTAKKEILLGLSRPRTYNQSIDISLDEELTPEQKSIVYKAFNTKDYFLIWGPPGTGKTSVVLKNLVRAIHKYTEEKILLLAYTNRAVDEICDALFKAGLAGQFIRIGSKYSVGENYTEHLLQSQMEDIETRSGIIKLLKRKRIIVSTVSSIIGKQELFKIINIDTVIIDEASQILEPMLIGLLTKFERFIMIGDHKQLPAVVTQNENHSKIHNENLNKLGLTDMRVSMFERLYMQCKKNKWDNAWEVLTQQGRMHVDLMSFVNLNFYEGKLAHIPKLKRLTQLRELKFNNPLEKILTNQRLIYINSDANTDFNWKTNEDEAHKVQLVLTHLQSIYLQNEMRLSENSIGIITPYRAQIALIKSKIEEENISVDTVERYQGGARDIIIISLCTNRISQLTSLVSLSAEGIDRKLNVALTRAKEQIIIIGNEDILSQNETYLKLINASYKISVD